MEWPLLARAHLKHPQTPSPRHNAAPAGARTDAGPTPLHSFLFFSARAHLHTPEPTTPWVPAAAVLPPRQTSKDPCCRGAAPLRGPSPGPRGKKVPQTSATRASGPRERAPLTTEAASIPETPEGTCRGTDAGAQPDSRSVTEGSGNCCLLHLPLTLLSPARTRFFNTRVRLVTPSPSHEAPLASFNSAGAEEAAPSIPPRAACPSSPEAPGAPGGTTAPRGKGTGAAGLRRPPSPTCPATRCGTPGRPFEVQPPFQRPPWGLAVLERGTARRVRTRCSERSCQTLPARAQPATNIWLFARTQRLSRSNEKFQPWQQVLWHLVLSTGIVYSAHLDPAVGGLGRSCGSLPKTAPPRARRHRARSPGTNVPVPVLPCHLLTPPLPRAIPAVELLAEIKDLREPS